MALVIDAIIVVIPAFVILSVLSWMIGGLWLFTGIGGVLLFLYSALLESAAGATIGKGVLGLKVVSIKGRLDFADALVRNVTKIYALLLLLEFIVSLFVVTTDAHQRYMDKLAKTTVIEKR